MSGRNSRLFCSVPWRMIIGAIDVTVRSGPGAPQYSNSVINRCRCTAPSPSPPYSAGQFRPNQPLAPSLRAKRGHLPAGMLQIVFGDLGAQGVSDVLAQELTHLGQPGALVGVEVEIHN